MKVLIAGDFSPEFRLAEMVEAGKYREVLGEAAPLVRAADYSMVNFESTITAPGDRPIRKCGPNLSCPPAAAEALKWAGFKMMTMANNHILDYGASSMRRNLDTFDGLGLDHVGAGMNLAEASRTFYKKIDGKTLAVINCCEHEFSIATDRAAGANPLDPVAQSYAIMEARKKADFVLVVVHGGHEHFQLPSPRMQRTYRFFVDCGADAVVNHHQHCFSGMEVYKGKPVFYGLGNFCFDYKGAKSKTWCEGFMLELNFDSDQVGWRTLPYRQCPGDHVGVFPMEGREGFDGEFSRLSQLIGSPDELRKAVEEYYDKAGEGYLLPFEPYDNRFLKALRYRRWIPSFFGQKRAVVIKNYINCEAHLDKLRHIIGKITPSQLRKLIRRCLSLLKQQGDGRRLMGNFLWLSLLQVAGYVFPLLTVPYLAHTIGVDKYGEIAFASAVMVYFQTLVDYGFIFSAVRDIARVREDLGAVSAIYSRVMWARFFLTLVAFTLLVGLILTVPKFYEMRWVILASFLLVVGHAMFPDWIFQAVERMKFIVIFNVGIKLLFTVAVFAFIRRPDDYLLQPVFTSVGFVLSGMGAMWLIHRWGIRLGRPRAAEIKRGLKSNFDLFVNQLVPNLYNSASVLMLGFMHGDAANGVYGAANQFNTVGSSFFSIISRTFFPFLSRRPEKHHVFVVINLVSSGLVAALLFGFAALIVHTFFPGSFDGSIVTLQILSVSLVFLAMSNVYGTNLLILRGRERELRQITLVSSLIGLAVGIPLVYFYSYIGVALTVVTARGAIALLSYLKARRIDRDLPPVAA